MSGMGELHLEVYVERIRREYGLEVEVGAPKVSYREQPTRKAEFDYKHKKQSGGSGQFAHIKGWIGPLDEEEFRKDENNPPVVDGFSVRRENRLRSEFPNSTFRPSKKAWRQSIVKGTMAE